MREFASQGDPPRVDEVERSQSDLDPKKNALRKRTPADVPEGCARDATADQKKCCRKAEPPQLKERFGKWIFDLLRLMAAVARTRGTIQSARASFTVVPIIRDCAP